MRYLFPIVVTLFLSACQTGPHTASMTNVDALASLPKCQKMDSENSCRILVDIEMPDPGTPNNKESCAVKVRTDQEVVGFKRGAKDKWITWEIDQAPKGDFQFTTAGISPKPPYKDAWEENFKNGIAQGRLYKWKNRNEAPGTYEYMVIVVNEVGVSCKQDPKINNQ